MRLNFGSAIPTIKRTYLRNPGERRFAIETVENCDPVLAAARSIRDRTEATPTRVLSKDNVSVAVVPLSLFYKLGMKDWDDKKLRAWLRDPENRHFLTGRATMF